MGAVVGCNGRIVAGCIHGFGRVQFLFDRSQERRQSAEQGVDLLRVKNRRLDEQRRRMHRDQRRVVLDQPLDLVGVFVRSTIGRRDRPGRAIHARRKSLR
jgi:hypothetical protein